MTNRNKNNSSVVRMTASDAREYFAHAELISAAKLQVDHIDVVQMSDIDLETRCALIQADDDLKAGLRDTAAVARIVWAHNQLVMGEPVR